MLSGYSPDGSDGIVCNFKSAVRNMPSRLYVEEANDKSEQINKF
jgi:hypothetical protein